VITAYSRRSFGSSREFSGTGNIPFRDLAELQVVEQVAPIQLAIRLLIPEGSLLMDLPEVRALVYPWRNRDAELERLAAIQDTIKREERRQAGRGEIFRLIWNWRRQAIFPRRRCRPERPFLT
jgi:hypothetical protein